LILVGSRSASLRSLPPRRLVRPFLPPRTADKEWAAVPTGPRRTRPHGRSLRVQRQRRAAVAVPSPTRCRGCRTPHDPPGITQDFTTSARRPRTCRVLPHGSRRSTSRPCSTDESAMSALVSEKPHHVPSMGF
jgi:hypothetical protein